MTPETVKEIEALSVRANTHTGSYDEADCEPYVVVPEGHKVESLQKLLPEPARIKRVMSMENAESFTRYVKKWADSSTEVLANQGAMRIQANIDGHRLERPSWVSHLCELPISYSREWGAWDAADRTKMTQVEFAEFLEDRIEDVMEPMGGELLTLCNQLQIVRKAVFGSSQRLASGEMSFTYSQENETGTVEIPSMIKLGIPVFKGGDPYEVKARFKYRLHEGDLKLWVELVDPDKYVEDAFNNLVAQIDEQLGPDIENCYRTA